MCFVAVGRVPGVVFVLMIDSGDPLDENVSLFWALSWFGFQIGGQSVASPSFSYCMPKQPNGSGVVPSRSVTFRDY